MSRSDGIQHEDSQFGTSIPNQSIIESTASRLVPGNRLELGIGSLPIAGFPVGWFVERVREIARQVDRAVTRQGPSVVDRYIQSHTTSGGSLESLRTAISVKDLILLRRQVYDI